MSFEWRARSEQQASHPGQNTRPPRKQFGIFGMHHGSAIELLVIYDE